MPQSDGERINIFWGLCIDSWPCSPFRTSFGACTIPCVCAYTILATQMSCSASCKFENTGHKDARGRGRWANACLQVLGGRHWLLFLSLRVSDPDLAAQQAGAVQEHRLVQTRLVPAAEGARVRGGVSCLSGLMPGQLQAPPLPHACSCWAKQSQRPKASLHHSPQHRPPKPALT